MAAKAKPKKPEPKEPQGPTKEQLAEYIQRLESRNLFLENTQTGVKTQLQGLLAIISAGDSPPRNES